MSRLRKETSIGGDNRATCSPRSNQASPLLGTGGGSVDVRLRGPLADDERNHFVRYRLTPANVGELRETEKELLVSRLIEHYSPIKEGSKERWPLAQMKHEKESLLTSLIASSFGL